MPSQEQILSGIRKRFLEQFNKALLKDGKVKTRRDLALSIGMHPTQIARFHDRKKPTNPMPVNIYLLCSKHGADLNYIFFGSMRVEAKRSFEDRLQAVERLLQQQQV